ncbi:MAG: GIY-YIG nuclease family protein [Bacteroidetes bacterium]|nr:GIY-YIG nuclease family protein [Bacteroidota bacterium]
MSYCIYILYSLALNRYYIGYTSDMSARIIRHNQGGKGFTGKVNDWELVYHERFETKLEALKREKEIKSWKSRIKLQELIAGSVHPD